MTTIAIGLGLVVRTPSKNFEIRHLVVFFGKFLESFLKVQLGRVTELAGLFRNIGFNVVNTINGSQIASHGSGTASS